MAWTTPKTWAVSEVVTAAMLNTHLKDNLNAIIETNSTDWSTWTPTLTGITQGNGTVVARYQVIAGCLFSSFIFTFGSAGSAMSTGIISSPVTLSSSYLALTNSIGTGHILDTGTTRFQCQVFASSTTALQPRAPNAAGTTVAIATDMSSTVPMTWAVGDVLAHSVHGAEVA